VGPLQAEEHPPASMPDGHASQGATRKLLRVPLAQKPASNASEDRPPKPNADINGHWPKPCPVPKRPTREAWAGVALAQPVAPIGVSPSTKLAQIQSKRHFEAAICEVVASLSARAHSTAFTGPKPGSLWPQAQASFPNCPCRPFPTMAEINRYDPRNASIRCFEVRNGGFEDFQREPSGWRLNGDTLGLLEARWGPAPTAKMNGPVAQSLEFPQGHLGIEVAWSQSFSSQFSANLGRWNCLRVADDPAQVRLVGRAAHRPPRKNMALEADHEQRGHQRGATSRPRAERDADALSPAARKGDLEWSNGGTPPPAERNPAKANGAQKSFPRRKAKTAVPSLPSPRPWSHYTGAPGGLKRHTTGSQPPAIGRRVNSTAVPHNARRVPWARRGVFGSLTEM